MLSSGFQRSLELPSGRAHGCIKLVSKITKKMEESQRKVISREEWENVLRVVNIRKEDMNKLVMNFLVTECYEKAAEKFIHESGTSAFSGDVNFQVAQQIMIETTRDGEVEYALDFGQECFTDTAAKNPHMLEEIERTRCLLAFEDPLNCPLGELMSASQRLVTANAVNQEILICEDHEKETKLYNMLRELILVLEQINEKAAYFSANKSFSVL